MQRARQRVTFNDREVEVIGWLSAGTPVPEIAKRIGVSDATVRVYLSTIRTKAIGWSDRDAGPVPETPHATEGHPTADDAPDGDAFARWLAAAG